LPEQIIPNLKKIENQPSYKKLVFVLSEWLTLMELCEDLVHRLQHYGIT